jgi:hypothetical protein
VEPVLGALRRLFLTRVAPSCANRYPPWSSTEIIALINGLTMKKQAERLGVGNDVPAIKAHPFFLPLVWDKLAAGELPVPFVPPGELGGTDNFDKEFTSEDVALTPPEADLIDSIDQREFEGFSFVNSGFIAPQQ